MAVPQADPYEVAELVEQQRPYQREYLSIRKYPGKKRPRLREDQGVPIDVDRDAEMEQLESGRKRSATTGEGGAAFRRRQNHEEDFDNEVVDAVADLADTLKTVVNKPQTVRRTVKVRRAPGVALAIQKKPSKSTARRAKRIGLPTSLDQDLVMAEVKPSQERMQSRKPPSVQRRRPQTSHAAPRQMVSHFRTTQRKSRAITYTNAPGLREWLEKQSNLQHKIDILLSQGKFKEAEKLRLVLLRRKYNL